jgi:hypothetical protein
MGSEKPRVFETRHFAKLAEDAEIHVDELCKSAGELAKGQGDSLGGMVWKKRLDKNRHRSIVIAKADTLWIFVFLFAKSDRDNINRKELAGFKKLARDYGAMSAGTLHAMLRDGDLREICHDREI